MKRFLFMVTAVVTVVSWVPAVAAADYLHVGAFAVQGPDGITPSHQRDVAVAKGNGTLYVANTVDDRVDTYQPAADGATLSGSIGAGDLTDPVGVAVDQDTGDVYVSDATQTRKYSSAGALDGFFLAPAVSGPLAVDPVSDDLLIADKATNTVRRYDSDGTFLGSFDAAGGPGVDPSPAGAFTGLLDIAADATGDILVVDQSGDIVLGGGTSRVERFSSTGSYEATIGASLTAASTVAVNTDNNQVVVGADQNSYMSSAQLSFHVYAADGTGLQDVSLPPSSSTLYGVVTGLALDGGLTARLYVATDVSGDANYGTASIQRYDVVLPAAPEATTGEATATGSRNATLRGTVDPNLEATTYHFEYGLTTAYGSSSPAAGGADAGQGGDPVAVVRYVNGLEPGMTYHYRLVATNGLGTHAGADHTVTTRAAEASDAAAPSGVAGRGFLPGDRGWEQVSPIEKNGNDVLIDTARVRAAVDGNAAAFASLGGFGDVKGSGVAFEYRSARTGPTTQNPTGWATHAITPQIDARSIIEGLLRPDPSYRGEFSPDLKKGVFRSASSVTPDANTAKVPNLYLRSDLDKPGSGQYSLLTTSQSPLDLSYSRPAYPDATPDLSRVLFETTENLTSDATGPYMKLYSSASGSVRLEGILPSDEGGAPALSSVAGYGSVGSTQPDPSPFYETNAISDDGSKVFFEANSPLADGQLYERRDGQTTVRLNASENAAPDPTPSPARFWAATPDGRYVYFTTNESLTEEDTDQGVTDVYRYDTTVPASGDNLTLISVDRASAAGEGAADGVFGVSDDGRYVYFVSALSFAGAPDQPLGPKIYVWHDGAIDYIGTLALTPTTGGGQDVANNLGAAGWTLSPKSSRVTPDGKTFVFSAHSGEGLTGYDHGSTCGQRGDQECDELYIYHAPEKRLVCASCRADGEAATADASIVGRFATGGTDTGEHLNHPLTDDGRLLFFTTGEPLAAGDRNGLNRDVYQYDIATGEQRLLSSGQASTGSYFLDASPSGDDVFFATRGQLTGWDDDDAYDLYDARVGGGVPEPLRQATPCDEDACQGAPPAVPAPPLAASVAFLGAGDQPVSARPGRVSISGARTVRGSVATLKVTVPSGGRITVSGSGLRRQSKTVKAAGAARVTVRLTARAAATMARTGTFKASVAVSFAPSSAKASSARVAITYKRTRPPSRKAARPRGRTTTAQQPAHDGSVR